MTTNKLEEFILTSRMPDLVDWIQDNSSMIYHYVNPLMKRMSEVGNDPNSIPDGTFGELLNGLYVNKDSVCEIDFNLLEECVRSIINNIGDMGRIPFNEEDYDRNKYMYLFLLFVPSYDLVNNIYQFSFVEFHSTKLYQSIMDVYIPNNNPTKVVSLLHDNFSLKEILNHAHDTSWFISRYKEKELDSYVNLSSILLLFKYISDIYTNREMSIDFFKKLHVLVRGSYSYINYFHEISERYHKYFGEDVNEIISSLYSLFDGAYVKDPCESVKELMMKISSKYYNEVSPEIITCLTNDICRLAITNHSDFFNNPAKVLQIKTLITDMWGLKDFNHDDTIAIAVDEAPFSISLLEQMWDDDIATEAVHNDSPVMNDASKKIYKAYRNYKSAEEKVDSQITKALQGIKGVLTGDVRSEIIEGKKFSAIGLLKKLLGTVAIFSVSKIGGVITLVVSYALKKNTSVSERRKIIMELETEIKLIDEKIQDARGDGNRDAKYAMMRTKSELENALKKIRYGMEADTRSLSNAKAMLNSVRNN